MSRFSRSFLVAVARRGRSLMFDQQIFDAEGDGSQDVNTLFSLSGEFLAAAQVLLAAPRGRVGYSSATYYLLGHSAELMLKAFLCKHGQTINDLRKLNHDLRKLAARARDAGLPERVPLDQILRLAAAYKEKSFEYRRNKNQTFPSLDLLRKR